MSPRTTEHKFLRSVPRSVTAMGRLVCHAHNNVDLRSDVPLEDIGVCAKAALQWLVRFSLKALEYGFGMYVGAVVGWVAGYCSGGIYAEYFEPLYLTDPSAIEEVMRWDQMPYTFAKAGVFVGAAVGALVMSVASRKAPDQSGVGPCRGTGHDATTD